MITAFLGAGSDKDIATAAQDPQLIDCIQSWTREVPVAELVNSSLFTTVIQGLDAPESFEAAVDCICTMIRETRDVDENLTVVERLYLEVMKLQPKITIAADEEDTELFTGIARIYTEASDNWVLLLARSPEHFRTLVEGIIEICDRDTERESIGHTFNFWFELKQYLTMERFMQSRLQYVDVYSKFLDILIKRLEYPTPEDPSQTDLFEGDREAEDNFKEFRHKMGSAIKDCCEVIGVTECLKKPFELIQAWMRTYGAQATATFVPHWQKLEAPIFAMRMMGRMVPSDESIMLPQLMPLLLQIPDHEKLRFQAVMTIGRYTEWTAQNAQTLQPQLQYIMRAFQHSSEDVVRAAALSFRFFCEDCVDLLKDSIGQIEQFYVSTLDKLPKDSQEELTEGVSAVIAKQPVDGIYPHLKICGGQILERVKSLAQAGLRDKAVQLNIAGKSVARFEWGSRMTG
jgi:transportin-3